MNSYRFRSTLPPDKIPELMAERIERSQTNENGLERIFVKWDNKQVTIGRTVQQDFTPQDGWQRTRRGKVVKGYSKNWDFSHPFCGTLRPDKNGGSIIAGRFVMHPAVKWIALTIIAIVSFSAYFNGGTIREILLYDIGILFLIAIFTKDREKSESANTILNAMREVFEEIT